MYSTGATTGCHPCSGAAHLVGAFMGACYMYWVAAVVAVVGLWPGGL
jgi:hypothetical protein